MNIPEEVVVVVVVVVVEVVVVVLDTRYWISYISYMLYSSLNDTSDSGSIFLVLSSIDLIGLDSKIPL